MTKTNQYGQPTTETGHVLKQRELIAAELDKLYEPIIDKVVSAAIRNDIDAVNRYAADGKKDLTTYVMDYAHTDWSKSVKHGIQLGRNDAVSMLKTLREQAIKVLYVADEKAKKVYSETPELAIPLSELQKIITALEETA